MAKILAIDNELTVRNEMPNMRKAYDYEADYYLTNKIKTDGSNPFLFFLDPKTGHC